MDHIKFVCTECWCKEKVARQQQQQHRWRRIELVESSFNFKRVAKRKRKIRRGIIRMRSWSVLFHFCIQYCHNADDCNHKQFTWIMQWYFFFYIFCLCWVVLLLFSLSLRTHALRIWRHHSHFISFVFQNFSSEFISFSFLFLFFLSFYIYLHFLRF